MNWPARGRRGTFLCTWLLGAERAMQQTLQLEIKEARRDPKIILDNDI